MYERGTKLALKEPKSTEEKVFPYDEVEVLGTSPISHSGGVGGEWEGVNAQGVVIAPLTEFSRNLDEPFGKLQALYKVTEVPDNTIIEREVKRYDATTAAGGKTPEEVFAEEAPGEASKDGKRGRTPHVESPLEDPRPKSDSPLDQE